MRTASAAAKPCQGDSLEFYLITGSIYTNQQGTVVITTVFKEVTKTLSSVSIDYHLPKPAVKEHQERCIIKAVQVTSSQDDKFYEKAKRDYAWVKISRCSRSHIHIQVKLKEQAQA
ncbi:hypothetical protein Tco_1199679 [Tanacetum coccineum]